MYYIGVDLGTSSVKLLMMDEKGEIKNIVSREYPLFLISPFSSIIRSLTDDVPRSTPI